MLETLNYTKQTASPSCCQLDHWNMIGKLHQRTSVPQSSRIGATSLYSQDRGSDGDGSVSARDSQGIANNMFDVSSPSFVEQAF